MKEQIALLEAQLEMQSDSQEASEVLEQVWRGNSACLTYVNLREHAIEIDTKAVYYQPAPKPHLMNSKEQLNQCQRKQVCLLKVNLWNSFEETFNCRFKTH